MFSVSSFPDGHVKQSLWICETFHLVCLVTKPSPSSDKAPPRGGGGEMEHLRNVLISIKLRAISASVSKPLVSQLVSESGALAVLVGA